MFYDLAGSYGVNLFGHASYKDGIARGAERVRDLGPVLGAYHPVVACNVERLRRISGLDEVSFHMSGTEAVMQAVRLARYHTRRPRLVRFCGAYHGWWGDVQPGIGNPHPQRDTYTLADMSERALRVLRTRRDIACVLVNPLQALHPNGAAPADSSLVGGGRETRFDRRAYADWLERLRVVCTERNIVLVFDEVFVGFRLSPGGAAEYFGVRPDLVTHPCGGPLPRRPAASVRLSSGKASIGESIHRRQRRSGRIGGSGAPRAVRPERAPWPTPAGAGRHRARPRGRPAPSLNRNRPSIGGHTTTSPRPCTVTFSLQPADTAMAFARSQAREARRTPTSRGLACPPRAGRPRLTGAATACPARQTGAAAGRSKRPLELPAIACRRAGRRGARGDAPPREPCAPDLKRSCAFCW